MGSRGPAPKRDAERRRRNKSDQPTDTVEVEGPVRIPAAGRDWSSRARAIYRAAKQSGMAQFYEPTDWQTLGYLCDLVTTLFRPGRLSPKMEAAIRLAATEMELNKDERLYLEWMLAPVRPSAQMVASLNSLFASLGLTESDRRRMRIEIRRNTEPTGPAPVSRLDEYRDRLGG